MRLEHIDIVGFKSFAKKSSLSFETAVTAVVGPNGSGKSNVVEAFRFVLGEQSMKSMRGKIGADLIFRGSSGAAKLSRAAVSITFDNRDKIFAFQSGEQDSGKMPILFDTITFTRELFADGTSKYLMNGTEIRLKQMVELLASVNIGTSSHHIISQGEADSILRASPKDRREMLEEALGLKLYHVRIKEAETKLLKTAETLKEVQSLRRELAPHLVFLKKQVEKIEKGRAIRSELEEALVRYISTERVQLQKEEQRISAAVSVMQHKKQELEHVLDSLPSIAIVDTQYAASIASAKEILLKTQDRKRVVETRMSRLEGVIEVERRLLTERTSQVLEETSVSFTPTEYIQLISDIEHFISAIKQAVTLTQVQSRIADLEPLLSTLKARHPIHIATQQQKTPSTESSQLTDAVLELEKLEREILGIRHAEQEAQENVRRLEQELAAHMSASRQATETRYETQNDLVRVDAELSILAVSKQTFIERKALFDSELKEAGFLFGPQFLRTIQHTEPTAVEILHDLKRTIDRLKIRLDEHSGIGNDVIGEYETTVERDAFLAREIADTEASIRNLEALSIDLKKNLDEKFTTGVAVINERFSEFFKTMFGGGSAFLEITIEKKRKRKKDELSEDIVEDEDSEDRFMERGIEVHVNLPEKKVKELTMLSGGERSLVSIALLFAISQVNPPPFLVLDETDAALDEANSRRYGDMIERLSEYSQLIVVTHNRETMSRASVLYGVTLGSDGASKLLSIKFDEAVKVAK